MKARHARRDWGVVCLGLALVAQVCVAMLGCDVRVARECPAKVIGEDTSWALWPMPNPYGIGLPNPSNYEVDADNGVVFDKVTCLMWKREVEADLLNRPDAIKRCDDLEFAGFSDWRLPTRIELVSLVDFTKAHPGPSIDTDAFPNTPTSPTPAYWTSSWWSSTGNAADGWVYTVFFDHGNTYLGGTLSEQGGTGGIHVRCVR